VHVFVPAGEKLLKHNLIQIMNLWGLHLCLYDKLWLDHSCFHV